jgi:hypothetical protein
LNILLLSGKNDESKTLLHSLILFEKPKKDENK